ncbi:MAG: hypothetical protein ABH865_01905 [Candidatus Omnitrophota bacterium]|nr:hypothetical protein [Candidatus Omnitrophota bacterium]
MRDQCVILGEIDDSSKDFPYRWNAWINKNAPEAAAIRAVTQSLFHNN